MLIFFAYTVNEVIMALQETIDISRLADRLQNATEGMIFAGVVALTRTAKHGQRAVQDNLPEVFNIRNKFTIQGIRITPATKQNQEAEVYSKDWYMPVHETGGQRSNAKGFWIPVGIRAAIGISKKELIPRWASPKNLLKYKQKAGRLDSTPFYRTIKGTSGIWARDGSAKYPIHLLYKFHTDNINIPQRRWFWDEISAAYDRYIEEEYNAALLEAWTK